MTSTSRAGGPRMRSGSMHLPSCIPVAPKTRKPRTKSAQRVPAKGAGKDKKTTKKSDKVVVVVSSDSEELEVDFPHHPPNQPHEVPAELPQESNPLADAPAEEQQKEPDHPVDVPLEDPHHPAHVPAGDAEQPQEPGKPACTATVPMANNQLNWSHFRPEFSERPEEDTEAHLLRTEDWMTTHDCS